MKQTIKLSITAVVIMFFIVSSLTAQDQSKSAGSDHKMMKNMQMKCDSTMMKDHKAMMKNGKKMCDASMMKNMQTKCDSTMMKDHKAMMKNGKKMCDASMMKNMQTKCDSTMMKDHKGMMDHDKMMKQNKMGGNNSVRKGVIDVAEIDKNKDGKVYQDVMDWNVISDDPGECPLCGMKLKEVTVDQAVKNLEKNGFKTK